MKTLLTLIINIILFLLSHIIPLILTPFNVGLVFYNDWRNKGFKGALKGISNYFLESAYRRDVYYCEEFRTLWNATLKVKSGAKFGKNQRSLSADLGQQDHEMTMSRTGAILNLILFLLDRNHSRKAYGK